jgi:GTPase SAR1 family protein
MIIEIIVIATLAALAGGTALNWNRVIIAVKGKKLAVLGARAVGKTHLLTFLRSGEIPTEYKQTATAQKVPSERRQLKDLELILKETLDLPGGQRHYREWKQLYRESDLVLYLFRVDKIVARDREIEERI